VLGAIPVSGFGRPFSYRSPTPPSAFTTGPIGPSTR
jgi:hypothetical protein